MSLTMLAQNDIFTVPVLGAGLVITWVLLLFLFLRQRKELATLHEALRGTTGERLEPLLNDHLRSKERLERAYSDLSSRLASMESWSRGAVCGVGLVRYDAFGDSGGMQSFVLALQSEEGDGVVLTSIVGRDQIRLYGKEVIGGRCRVELTGEEQEALKLARRRRAASRE
jgi:hypothetical protein